MSAKNKADLTTDNSTIVASQVTPESITPTTLSGLLQSIIDSMWNTTDNLLTFPPVNLTKLQLSTRIGAAGLNDRANGFSSKQWIQITDRADGNPLWVQSEGTALISPYGIWIKAGKPLAVIMDYVNGYQGETNPFIAIFDENRILNIPKSAIIADGSQQAGAVFVSDANGLGTWKKAISGGGTYNPAGMTGASAKMMGIGLAVTPGKSGTILVCISGEYVSADIVTLTNFLIVTGTGAPPANGAALSGVIQQSLTKFASSATDRIPFSLTTVINLTPGTAHWLDMALSNNASSGVQIFNTSISLLEQ